MLMFMFRLGINAKVIRQQDKITAAVKKNKTTYADFSFSLSLFKDDGGCWWGTSVSDRILINLFSSCSLLLLLFRLASGRLWKFLRMILFLWFSPFASQTGFLETVMCALVLVVWIRFAVFTSSLLSIAQFIKLSEWGLDRVSSGLLGINKCIQK